MKTMRGQNMDNTNFVVISPLYYHFTTNLFPVCHSLISMIFINCFSNYFDIILCGYILLLLLLLLFSYQLLILYNVNIIYYRDVLTYMAIYYLCNFLQ